MNSEDLIIDEEIKKRKSVLIIDEVDTFFQDNFYGKTFNPIAKYRSPEVSSILRNIWNKAKPRENKTKYTIQQLFQEIKESDDYK